MLKGYNWTMRPVPTLDLTWMIDAVNEFSDQARAAAGEEGLPYPDPSRIAGQPPEAGLLQQDRLVAAATKIYPVFALAHEGQPIAPCLNRLLDETRPSPRLDGATLTWVAEHGDDRLDTAMTLAVMSFYLEHGQARLGLCSGARCADVFADVSRAGRRRFCSNTCLNRFKVNEHRARKREVTARSQ